jgi:hypothetical protein
MIHMGGGVDHRDRARKYDHLKSLQPSTERLYKNGLLNPPYIFLLLAVDCSRLSFPASITNVAKESAFILRMIFPRCI